MADTTLQLAASRTVTLDSSGNGSVVFNNGGLSKWVVKLMNTTTTGTTQPKCTVYRGEAAARNQIDFTRLGSGDTSATDITFNPGSYITVVWTGGTAGAIATFTIEGDDIIKGQRGY